MKYKLIFLSFFFCFFYIGCTERNLDLVTGNENLKVFQNIRIIVGNGTIIENGALAFENGVIIYSGPQSDMEINSNAMIYDSAGLTMMPAIIDTHTHLGNSVDSLTRDLQQRASIGIAAAMSMGTDDLGTPLEFRVNPPSQSARYFSAGRGITMPEPGRSEIPHWVTNENEAREAVRAEAERNVDMIKIWVDDRNGQYEKLSPYLFSAIIDEAHNLGLRVSAHIFNLDDAKELVESGVDVLAHGVRDQDIDEEFIQLVQNHPDLVLIANLPSSGRVFDYDWLEYHLTEDQLIDLRTNNIERPEMEEFFSIQARNLARLSDTGTIIALGTDGNTFWAPHIEMEEMVFAGMNPHDVIIAATKNGAELLLQDDLGTLEVGKSASFILLNDNPLADIRNTRAIASIYLDGNEIFNAR